MAQTWLNAIQTANTDKQLFLILQYVLLIHIM